MEKDIYKMIDRFLIQLEENQNGVRIPFNRSLPKGKIALQLMMKHELADFGTNDIASIGIVQKNLNGIKILQAQGFEKWIDKNNLKESTIEMLEFRKLELDVKNSERIYKTYWLTFWMALIAFILSLVLGLSQLIKKEDQPPVIQQQHTKPSSVIK
jgi:hypothetical protein